MSGEIHVNYLSLIKFGVVSYANMLNGIASRKLDEFMRPLPQQYIIILGAHRASLMPMALFLNIENFSKVC